MRFVERAEQKIVLEGSGESRVLVAAEARVGSEIGARIAFARESHVPASPDEIASDPSGQPIAIVLRDSQEALELSEVARRLGAWLREKGR